VDVPQGGDDTGRAGAEEGRGQAGIVPEHPLTGADLAGVEETNIGRGMVTDSTCCGLRYWAAYPPLSCGASSTRPSLYKPSASMYVVIG
jgi:hypothetical protein